MDTTSTTPVLITVNGQPHRIQTGPQTGTRIKHQGEVPPSDELDQVVEGELIPVEDNAFVTIVGGEVFLSHPPSGGSS